MSDNRDLIPGETELLHVNKHMLVLVRRVIMPTLVVAVIVVVGAVIHVGSSFAALRWFVLLAVALALFVYLDLQYIIWRSETYTITNDRVLLRRGVIGRYSRSISLNRVQDVTTNQDFFGRIFNFGTLEIESAGEKGAQVLTYVPHPDNFRNVLFERLQAAGGRTSSP